MKRFERPEGLILCLVIWRFSWPADSRNSLHKFVTSLLLVELVGSNDDRPLLAAFISARTAARHKLAVAIIHFYVPPKYIVRRAAAGVSITRRRVGIMADWPHMDKISSLLVYYHGWLMEEEERPGEDTTRCVSSVRYDLHHEHYN